MEKEQIALNEQFKGGIKSLREDVTEVKGDIKTIKENHLTHIEADVRVISTDTAWLKKFFWVVVAASVGGLATAIFNAIQVSSQLNK